MRKKFTTNQTKLDIITDVYIQFCGSSLAGIVGSNAAGCIIVFLECCVLSGRGLCDLTIPRPEESYRVWCVYINANSNPQNKENMTPWGFRAKRKK